MKCWKCGKENADGAGTCIYCGASANRTPPVTEVGGALRSLYDLYGADKVFSNSAFLANGLGDLQKDSKPLRNQIRLALDSGVGRLYLEQLKTGAPDAGFDLRVKKILTEEAALNDRAAAAIAGYFDEMVGWREPAEKPATPQRAPKEGPVAAGKGEIDRTRQKAAEQSNRKSRAEVPAGGVEVKRGKRETAVPAAAPFHAKTAGTAAAPFHAKTAGTAAAPFHAKTAGKTLKQKLYSYEAGVVACTILLLIVGSFLNSVHDPENYSDIIFNAIMLVPFAISLGQKKDGLRSEISVLACILTGIVAFLIVFDFGDMIHRINLIGIYQNETGDIAEEVVLWAEHLKKADIVFIVSTVPLFIRMLIHRIQENAKRRSLEDNA